jgi:large subunit ribosomal protein L29
VKVDEIRALKPGELEKQLEEAYKELFDLRFRLSTRQLVNHNEIRRVKKDIAKIKTVIRERELEIR